MKPSPDDSEDLQVSEYLRKHEPPKGKKALAAAAQVYQYDPSYLQKAYVSLKNEDDTRVFRIPCSWFGKFFVP